MRYLVGIAVLLATLGVVVLSSRAPVPPEPQNEATREMGAEAAFAGESSRRELIASVVEAAGPVDAITAGLEVPVLEHGTRRPLPEVGVRAWLYPRGPKRYGAELLASGETLEIFVPRGPWRTFRVVGPDGAPLPGVSLEEPRLRPAVTGSDGVGRVRMSVPPPNRVTVWAPGFRVEQVPVPPEGEPWEIVLGPANRLEFLLTGARNHHGYHVELDLPATMQQRTFHQTKYVQTPGRPAGGTRGRWSAKAYRGASHWSLGFDDAGLAVIDHLYDAGTITAELWYFGERLETRGLELKAEGRVVRTDFAVTTSRLAFVGRVVDAADRSIPEVLVRMAPLGGRATIDQPGREGFPVWAPSTGTDDHGGFRLPRPADRATVVVFSKLDFADRALTVAEIEAAEGRVLLEKGNTVVVEVRGRNGEVLDGGWSSGDAYLHVRPRVHLGHDVWRDVSPRHPARAEENLRPPYFRFADLPSGVVTFGFTYLAPDELLRHDTRFPTAYYQTSSSLSELMIGK